MAALRDTSVIFDNLSTKFTNLLYSRTEGDSKLISKTLDELNSLNYKYQIIANPTKAVLLINQCCTLINPDDSILVSKCCQLITDLVTHQRIQIEGKILKGTIEWCIHALKQGDNNLVDVLIAIDALLRINSGNTQILLKDLLTNQSPLVLLAENTAKQEYATFATQCLEACTSNLEDLKLDMNVSSQFNICAKIFMNYLTNDKTFTELLHYGIIVFTRVRNIVIRDASFLESNLGILLGIIRSYMLYGVRGIDFISPQKLLPSQLSIPESTVNTLRERKGGKVTKLRKNKTANTDTKRSEVINFDGRSEGVRREYIPATEHLDCWNNIDSSTGFPKVKTSDSEFSDSETVTAAKITQLQRKIRQASLNLFLKIIKTIDKRTMFSYWSSFIPDGSPSGTHSICACILKDPSSSTRSVALNVLLTLLSNSKLYLSQAEYSEKNTPFTPFSATLGSMILEMHKCLRFALNENSIPVLSQVLKCLAELVQASPYHRLIPGIITKVVRSVKVFLDHKDVTVQVRALIVLGCILASEPPIPETKIILLKCSSNKEKISEYTSGSTSESKVSNEDIEYANFSTDDEEPDQESFKNIVDVPWILKVCLRCLGVVINSAGDCVKSTYTVPSLVKLESLQVLSAMARNYFTTLIAPYLLHIAKGLEVCLSLTPDKFTDLRLHTGSTIDSIGQAMSLYFINNPDKNFLSVEQGLVFWNALLNGPLLSLVENEEHSPLRAVACDCLGSIGADIFERLAKDKQMLIIMMLFGCSRDEESNVRGAAVRALAISVLYPSLREDSGFVIDTAEVIYRTIQDANLTVKAKASWSLANLTNALVLNKDNPNIIEDVPEKLLADLIKISIKGCKDNDKVKANTVRALGDLLQLLSEEQMKTETFRKDCIDGIKSLIHCSSSGSNMKSLWNSCHSLGKVLKNSTVYVESHLWQKLMFDNLMNLVVGFKNFKVRISAALALSCVVSRRNYGEYYFSIWKALLRALENSENMEDYTEYKHRDNLVDQVIKLNYQPVNRNNYPPIEKPSLSNFSLSYHVEMPANLKNICLSIGHLATLLTSSDIHFLQDDIIFYCELLKCNVQKVYERVIPEKAGVLTAAEENLKTLSISDLSSEQKDICLSIGHLATLLTSSDIHFLQDDIIFYCELLKCNVQKVYERVIPEKAGVLTAAEENLKTLSISDLSSEQKDVLYSLINVFNNNNI
ncbi:malaria antigen-related [Holotrichia oblita]|uniref:Malaria antigen-related n=1 Tax=Holotrichia oblita TaxID=644536 RepID=A0ACB9SNA4_HOLOL|nr:malaria antigen-related [Holotrichia oblita]